MLKRLKLIRGENLSEPNSRVCFINIYSDSKQLDQDFLKLYFD